MGARALTERRSPSPFERARVVASRGARRDWASRFVLPLVEEFATEQLMERRVRPEWLIWIALGLTFGAAFAFTRGWLWPAVGLMVASTPLDLIGARLATLRLKPIKSRSIARRLGLRRGREAAGDQLADQDVHPPGRIHPDRHAGRATHPAQTAGTGQQTGQVGG